jgi:hypothetical protein
MSSNRQNDLTIMPDLEREQSRNNNINLDSKFESSHEEGDSKRVNEGYVADQDAQGYVNPDLIISPEENKRLKRRIDRR